MFQMKNHVGEFFILSSFILLAVSQGATGTINDLIVEPPEIDLGKIDQDRQATFQFTIKNDGNIAFEFELHRSCRCQALTHEKGVIRPKSSLVVGGILTPSSQGKRVQHVMPLILEYRDMNERKSRFGKRINVTFEVTK